MNPAEIATALVIEETIGNNSAYRKVDDRLYVVKQGSAYVMVNIVPWGDEQVMVRCVSQVLKGIDMTRDLAVQLLQMNAHLRFGAFAYDRPEGVVLFIHSILGGHSLDAEQLMATLSDVALIADEWDDKLMEKYGGQRMQDVLEEEALKRILETEPGTFGLDDEQAP